MLAGHACAVAFRGEPKTAIAMATAGSALVIRNTRGPLDPRKQRETREIIVNPHLTSAATKLCNVQQGLCPAGSTASPQPSMDPSDTSYTACPQLQRKLSA